MNFKEYGLIYTIGVRCDYDDWIVAHQEEALSYTHGVIKKALLMNESYVKLYGGEKLTMDILRALPNSEFEALIKAVSETEKSDSMLTIETEEEKPKKAKSAGKSI